MKKHRCAVIIGVILLALISLSVLALAEESQRSRILVITSGNQFSTNIHLRIDSTLVGMDVNPPAFNLSDYDGLIVDGDSWGPEMVSQINNFLASGKWVIVTAGTPFYLSDGDIPSLVWLGTQTYGNTGGEIFCSSTEPYCLLYYQGNSLGNLEGSSFSYLADPTDSVTWALTWNGYFTKLGSKSQQYFSYAYLPDIGGQVVYIAAGAPFVYDELINPVVGCLLNGCLFNPESYCAGTIYPCGDVDCNGIVDVDDAVFLIHFIFMGGDAPCNCLPASLCGDVDCNGIVDVDDAVFLISYIFFGGPEPCFLCKM